MRRSDAPAMARLEQVTALVVAAGLAVMGLYTDDIVTYVIRFALPAGVV